MAKSQLRIALQYMFLSGLAVGALNLFVQITFARVLGITIIAEYAKIAVFVNFVSIFTSFGFNQAVIGRGFTVRRLQNCLTLVLIQIGLTLLIFLVFAIVLWFSDFKDLHHLWIPALFSIGGMILLLPAHTFNSEIESKIEYGKLASMRVLAFVCANAGAGLLCYLDPSVYVLPFRDFLNAFTYLIFSFLLLRSPIALRFDKKVAFALIRFAKNVWLNNLSTEGAIRLDFALVGLTLSSSHFAIYFQTRNLFEGSLGFIVYPIRSAVFSYMRRHRSNLQFSRLNRRFFQLTVLAGAVGMLAFGAFGEDLIVALLGEKWRVGGEMMVPMAAYAAMTVYFEILVSMSKALNKMGRILIARGVGVAAIAVIVPVFALHWGIAGAGWATAIASMLLVLAAELMAYTGSVQNPSHI